MSPSSTKKAKPPASREDSTTTDLPSVFGRDRSLSPRGRELKPRGRKTMISLMDAAVAVFATQGYHATRVDDIVSAAETSHGTFYLYFTNKEELFAALIAEVADELLALTDGLGIIAPDPSGIDTIRSWVGEFAAVYKRYAPVISSWTEAESEGDEVGTLGEQVLDGLAESLSGHLTANAMGGLDPRMASLTILAMIERFNYFAITGQTGRDQSTNLDTLASVIHASLYGTP